jgi:hypothetical protein
VKTDRIPGFAICAHCSGRCRLAACRSCGLLTCAECRGGGQCILCFREREAIVRRFRRRERLRTFAQRSLVVACVGLSGFTVAGAALLPLASPELLSDPHADVVARGQARVVAGAVGQYLDEHSGACPSALHVLSDAGYLVSPPIDPWGEPLLFGCVDQTRSFVILSKGADREVGTPDDVMVSSPP